jgi:hypothetical protein
MLNTREQVMTALFARLSAATFVSVNGSTTFKTKSRRIKLWGDVSKDSRPAMFMVERHESPTFVAENQPAKQSMMVDVFVYTSADGVEAPSVDINNILDALDAALAPGPAERVQTLGGLVSHCRQEGQIFKDPGDLDNDGLIIYPIRIMAT